MQPRIETHTYKLGHTHLCKFWQNICVFVFCVGPKLLTLIQGPLLKELPFIVKSSNGNYRNPTSM